MKDKSKVFGLCISIIVSMAGIAVLNLFGLVQLNPKPMFWLNFIVGGSIFGVGMVLAGGCVGGCLYKTGTGNINSMAGLVGIPIGIAIVEYGPLHSFFISMKKFVLTNSDGGVISLSSITGLPYWFLALLFIVALFSGILVGIGAAFTTGCVIGNILSGWALMSVGLLLFGIVTILANWLTTYFYLMGGKLIHNKVRK